MRQIRFIPARAGNTRPTARAMRYTSVHPRPRGEHVWCYDLVVPVITVHPRPRGEHLFRIGASPDALSTVHPRPRGEHCSHKILIQKLLLLT